MIQDWVLEMWGYAIAAASVGVHHDVRQLQIEPGASAHLAADFASKYYIFHYTYGIEYKMDGTPQGVNQIGVWSLDKRHYGGSYPPLELDPPPGSLGDHQLSVARVDGGDAPRAPVASHQRHGHHRMAAGRQKNNRAPITPAQTFTVPTSLAPPLNP